jgi:hypothetical protein
MTEKTYSVEEANALLPYLAPTLVELRDVYEEAARIRSAMARSAAGNGWSEKREKWSRKLARVAGLVARLQEWEVILRDVDSGLVDFISERDGRTILLCWKLGEEEVSHWHSPEDGFEGRRPL